MKSIPGFLNKKIAITALIYFLINAVLLFRFGIQLRGEADKFIDNANNIIRGEELFNGVFGYFYIVYTFLVALCIRLSLNLAFIILLQILLSFVAAYCLYKLLNQALSQERVAFIFFIIYLLCYPVQKWNFFLYSESIHCSLLVITLYWFNKWLTNKKIQSFIVSIILLLLVFFSRPVGLLFAASLLVVLLYWLYKNKKILQFYMLTAVTMGTFVLVFNSPYTAFVNPDSIRRMEIICQVPEAKMDTVYTEYNREGLYKAFSVIRNEVGVSNFFKTGFKKLGSFFGMYRSYYSWHHNFLLLCFTIFYPFVLLCLFLKPGASYSYVRLFALTYLLLTSAGIFFTCDEWSNRFISAAFPFILILAAGGVAWVLTKFKTRPEEISS